MVRMKEEKSFKLTYLKRKPMKEAFGLLFLYYLKIVNTHIIFIYIITMTYMGGVLTTDLRVDLSKVWG